MEQDKVLQAMRQFRTHATKEQKKESLERLEKDCLAEVTFKDYISNLKRDDNKTRTR